MSVNIDDILRKRIAEELLLLLQQCKAEWVNLVIEKWDVIGYIICMQNTVAHFGKRTEIIAVKQQWNNNIKSIIRINSDKMNYDTFKKVSQIIETFGSDAGFIPDSRDIRYEEFVLVNRNKLLEHF